MENKFKQEKMKTFNKKVFDNADFVYETKNNICAVNIKQGKNGMIADKKRYFAKTAELQNNLTKSYGKPREYNTRKWYK